VHGASFTSGTRADALTWQAYRQGRDTARADACRARRKRLPHLRL